VPNSFIVCRIPCEKVSIVCCKISADGYFLCAADSEKNVYLFDRLDAIWDLFVTFETDKRILHVQFDRDRKHLVMTGTSYILGLIFALYVDVLLITVMKGRMFNCHALHCRQVWRCQHQ
jgi:hypothetical protein